MKKEQQTHDIPCECGGLLRPAKLDVYDFSDYVGLNVTVNNVDGFRCDKCGGETVDESLINMVTNYTIVQVAKSQHRLNGDEARYLRRSLHATQSELAARMGIDRVTVADWERGAEKISPQHDYILRGLTLAWMVAENLLVPNQMKEILGSVGNTVRQEPPKKTTAPIAVPNPQSLHA